MGPVLRGGRLGRAAGSPSNAGREARLADGGPLSDVGLNTVGSPEAAAPVRLPDGRTPFAWVHPVSGPPIRGGFVDVAGGIVQSVGREAAGSSPPPVAVLPRTVNLHTHLELSGMLRPLGEGLPLHRWVLEVLSRRPPDAGAAIEAGGREIANAGGGLTLDITQPGQADPIDGEATVLRATELIGLDPAVGGARLSAILEAGGHAISPHAPYSVHPNTRDAAAAEAKARDLLVTTHLAESPAERQLLERGDGPFVETLRTIGVWQDGLFGGRTFADEIEAYADVSRFVVAHGNELRLDEFERLARPGTSVAYCPRTTAFFGHTRHPVLEMREAGVTVGLGTDSRASNPDLSIWNEVGFLRRERPDIPPAALIEMATREGATALGRADRYGSIEPGREATALCVRLARPDATDPYDALFG